MANFNKVILLGNLTRDVELRYTANNTPVAGWGMAINRKWKNQQGEQQEEVVFVDLDAFGRVAEVVNQYVRKGDPLLIEGRLKLDQWQDRDGNNRSKLKVVVESVQLLGGGQGGGDQRQSQRRSSPPAYSGPAARHAPQQGAHQVIDDSDIPFAPDVPRDF